MSLKDKTFGLPAGKGLFVFSDPGGAKPLLALAHLMKSRLSGCRIISDRKYSFYADFDDVVFEDRGAAHELKIFNPDFVLTGTSYTSDIELQYLQQAKEFNIPAYTFVDHQTLIKERFRLGDDFIFPDKILLTDEASVNAAEAAGIPPEKIILFGNPYHDYLQSWKPKLDKEAFFTSIGLSAGGKKLIVYAPDPLSNIDGMHKYGFDEISATEKINRLAAKIADEYIICLTPHPNQNIDLLTAAVTNNIKFLPKGTDVNSLMFYSDKVVGFFSNFLKEALVMNKKVVRFIDTDVIHDPYKGMNIGIAVNADQFINIITA